MHLSLVKPFTMFDWARVTVVFCFCVAVSSAEITVNQPPSKSTSLGGTVQITCTLSGASLGSSTISWYQQKSGSAHRYLLYHYAGSSTNRASGVPNRFSGSVSGNTGTLSISRVESGDAADYYCAIWKSSIGYFGTGTKLSVGSPREPSVSLLPPSSVQITEKNTATLVCLVSGFNPGAVEIEWTVDGSVKGNGVETSRIQQETDNTFSVSSYLTLSASEWNSHERYSCGVKHETQATPFQTSISRSSCM
ncbi:immunoglobulin lambda-1 light chain-like [Hemiscyllium ocellatum]|uniref:immunoglobulin lambda-1 light chain-like n=1 Tax=Hemiscyllium ocellatum TaxID=170820 RepID=UPI0029663DE7|nr:immunoglobulin lambda-1 light chain-like [Hemiscyllium ocellatum]